MGSNGCTNGTHTGKVLIQVSSRLRARCTSEENESRSWTILLFLQALLYNSFENRRMGDVVINVRMPWVYSARNKRWHQNVVRTSVTNSTAPCCYPFLFLQTFWRHLRVLTEQTRGNIYLSSKQQATGIAEVMGSNPVRAWNFFQVLLTTTSFSSVLSCEDLLISSFHRSANMWIFHISKIFIHWIWFGLTSRADSRQILSLGSKAFIA